MRGRRFSLEEKLIIVLQFRLREKSLSQLSCEYQVSQTSIRKWNTAYQVRDEANFPYLSSQKCSADIREARIAELERFCGQLAMENSTLKKSFGPTSVNH